MRSLVYSGELCYLHFSFISLSSTLSQNLFSNYLVSLLLSYLFITKSYSILLFLFSTFIFLFLFLFIIFISSFLYILYKCVLNEVIHIFVSLFLRLFFISISQLGVHLPLAIVYQIIQASSIAVTKIIHKFGSTTVH